jgi:glycosyltransferase involved in cell wall biosynthesis
MHIGYRYLDKNLGAAGARNAGIALCTGAWIAFLDDDVCVEPDWYEVCIGTISEPRTDIVGIEGRLEATGDGVWDREVEVLTGKSYLTGHIIYRKIILDRIGGFDEYFTSGYPTCEDHELAVRALLWGDISFNPQLCARHLPRTIRPVKYLMDSFLRIRSLLDAEYYFFHKHRDRYHTMRYARTFWGTYKNIVLFHAVTSLKRRDGDRLINHPLQAATLMCASILEQLSALFLFVKYCFAYSRHSETFFKGHIREQATRRIWQLNSGTDLSVLRLKPKLFHSLFFPILRKPVYSIFPLLLGLKRTSDSSNLRIFLRIDDVFLNDSASVALLCEKISDLKIRYCAGITGNDLCSTDFNPEKETILRSGGIIALHGFSHCGTFGPFMSEILQMNVPALESNLTALRNHIPVSEFPNIFIPPFNAISREQIVYLTNYFKVICGGPETARFTDYFTGPVALVNTAWYVPSFFPFYNNASTMLQSKEFHCGIKQVGVTCITVHMPLEARDGFGALMRLLKLIADKIAPWEYFFEKEHA